MKLEKYCLQAGVCMILLAVFLRLCSTGALAAAIEKPAVFSVLLFMETGRWAYVQEEPPRESPTPVIMPTPKPATPAPADPAPLTFQTEDADLVEVYNDCGYEADIAAMLQKPLSWDLTADGPTVLILHSHGSEGYRESSGYRSLDTGYNVVSVGTHLKEQLEQAGIGVIHDTTMHDQPSYNDSYIEAREAIEEYLEEYPSIRLVLDIHRDAVETADGTQKGYTQTVDGQEAAQLMMVVGTDAGGRNHPNWEENLSLAVKLHVQLEKQNPGICRPISFRAQRFNQDLSAGGMLIEVGAAGNSREEALLGAEVLAEGIIALAHGTEGTLY